MLSQEIIGRLGYKIFVKFNSFKNTCINNHSNSSRIYEHYEHSSLRIHTDFGNNSFEAFLLQFNL
jgi:hypothetical protein